MLVKASKEFELKAGERVVGALTKSDSKLFRFYVPNDLDIHSISISLEVGGNTSMVRMFATIAKTENDQPSSQNSMTVLPSWFGLIARVYEDNSNFFCRDCTYKVLINSNEEMQYTLHYTTSKTVTKIKEEQYQAYDVVSTGDQNCYEFNVKNPAQTMEVYLNAFSGDPDIYVNPLTLPRERTQFAFSSNGKIGRAHV